MITRYAMFHAGSRGIDGAPAVLTLILIHRWGWTITLHPDGTTTMRSPDGNRILPSHSPPA